VEGLTRGWTAPANGPKEQRVTQTASVRPSGDTFVIDNYVKRDDRFTITVNHSTMQLAAVAVKSWLDKPKDAVSGDIRFSRLPDGAVYPAFSSVNVSAEHLTITTVNSNYSIPLD